MPSVREADAAQETWLPPGRQERSAEDAEDSSARDHAASGEQGRISSTYTTREMKHERTSKLPALSSRRPDLRGLPDQAAAVCLRPFQLLPVPRLQRHPPRVRPPRQGHLDERL
eukprot:scaffold1220_cov259-Pinguiococcus_pyrenoidosus.AAC.55